MERTENSYKKTAQAELNSACAVQKVTANDDDRNTANA